MPWQHFWMWPHLASSLPVEFTKTALPCWCWAYPEIIAVHGTTLHLGIPSSTWHASARFPHLENVLKSAFPMPTSESSPCLMICVWTNLPNSSTVEVVNALRTLTKEMQSGFTPSCCILWNNSTEYSLPMLNTACYHGIPRYKTPCQHSVEHLECICHPPKSCLHACESIFQMDIWLNSTSSNMSMELLALF